MNETARMTDNTADDGVDDAINVYADLAKPTSFFLYAGAGSGKTRSLVKAINRLREHSGRRLALRGQRIGAITYTNAACDEIKERLDFDPLVAVSTLHSFAWSLIRNFHTDIRAWLRQNLAREIADLTEAQAKGRPGTKIAAERERSIETKRNRLALLDKVKAFIYSPTGDNRERDALNHAEVIAIAADFLKSKPALQGVLVNQYPVLFVDESQDTNRHLMDALLAVQRAHERRFCLGLFGDTMQRIYSDGKADLEQALPDSWARPAKKMNHRCPGRVIRLINRIRSYVDDQQQIGRTDKPHGFVRLFIISNDVQDKFSVEARIAQRMAEITGDSAWTDDERRYKTLMLEHHMAAKRMGFDAMFEPLYKVDKLRTGLLNGTQPGLRFFSANVLPLVEASRKGDQFAVAAAVRTRSPLLDRMTLKDERSQLDRLKKAKAAAESLMGVWAENEQPSFLDVLRNVAKSGLFAVPDVLAPFAQPTAADDLPAAEDADEQSDELAAWSKMIGTSFEQIGSYDRYVSGLSPFDTHQGVKGREFPRVMVIINDSEARGFLFSYEKLFGAKAKSNSDLKNESEGAETTIDRTRRLFYVTCSRTESSLAIVAYSENPQMVRTRAIAEGWFAEDEVELSP